MRDQPFKMELPPSTIPHPIPLNKSQSGTIQDSGSNGPSQTSRFASLFGADYSSLPIRGGTEPSSNDHEEELARSHRLPPLPPSKPAFGKSEGLPPSFASWLCLLVLPLVFASWFCLPPWSCFCCALSGSSCACAVVCVFALLLLVCLFVVSLLWCRVVCALALVCAGVWALPRFLPPPFLRLCRRPSSPPPLRSLGVVALSCLPSFCAHEDVHLE